MFRLGEMLFEKLWYLRTVVDASPNWINSGFSEKIKYDEPFEVGGIASTLNLIWADEIGKKNFQNTFTQICQQNVLKSPFTMYKKM